MRTMYNEVGYYSTTRRSHCKGNSDFVCCVRCTAIKARQQKVIALVQLFLKNGKCSVTGVEDVVVVVVVKKEQEEEEEVLSWLA